MTMNSKLQLALVIFGRKQCQTASVTLSDNAGTFLRVVGMIE
jgi:hypothetical protein